MVKTMICAALALAACGGKHKQTTEEPLTQPVPADQGPKYTDTSGNMLPPEQAEAVTRALGRKQNIVSHCLATAVDNKELPKNSHGKMTLEIVFAQGGAVQSAKILSSTLESKTLSECVLQHVEETQVEGLAKRYETSYTYAFEAM